MARSSSTAQRAKQQSRLNRQRQVHFGADLSKLSVRELQTLVMIPSGKRLSEIATDLVLSPKTVSVCHARVLEKLQLANNSELTVCAIRNGLVGE